MRGCAKRWVTSAAHSMLRYLATTQGASIADGAPLMQPRAPASPRSRLPAVDVVEARGGVERVTGIANVAPLSLPFLPLLVRRWG